MAGVQGVSLCWPFVSITCFTAGFYDGVVAKLGKRAVLKSRCPIGLVGSIPTIPIQYEIVGSLNLHWSIFANKKRPF